MSLLYFQLQEKLNGHIYNGYFTSLCPFHDDHSPSFFVWEDGKYKCKTCGKSGSLDYLNRYLGGHDIKTSKSKSQVSPQWKLWEHKYGDLDGIAEHAHEVCKKFPNEMWYMKQRKIDQFFEFGYFGMIENWMLFPVFDIKHKIQNIVVRNTKKKDIRYVIKHIDDSKPLLYCPNWERVMRSDMVYVPFGIVDSWAFEDIGLACVTGITGKSLSYELLSKLDKKYIFVPDYKENNEAHCLANRLGMMNDVLDLTYPEHTKDPDEVRTKYGNNYLLELLGVMA